MSATARLIQSVDAEVQDIVTADGASIVALVLPGSFRPADAQALADEFHAALTRALAADLGPLRVAAERTDGGPT